MTMVDELQARLSELRREYALGEGRLRELMEQESALRETLLRISGAIQVLDEVIGSRSGVAQPPTATPADAGDTADLRPQVPTMT